MTDSGFTVDVDQNQYLPEGGRDVSAVVTVTSGPDVAVAAPGGGAGSAEIIIIDCSGSMDYPPTKMSQAKVATAAAGGRDGDVRPGCHGDHRAHVAAALGQVLVLVNVDSKA